jgi:hypothetical protein
MKMVAGGGRAGNLRADEMAAILKLSLQNWQRLESRPRQP